MILHLEGRPCGAKPRAEPRACRHCDGGDLWTKRRAHCAGCRYAPNARPWPCARCATITAAQKRKAEREAVLARLHAAPTFEALGKITPAEERLRRHPRPARPPGG